MSKTILRILVSELAEEKFVLMNAIESRGKVDLVLIVEHNFTHSGKRREFVYKDREDNIKKISGNSAVKVLSIDLKGSIVEGAATSEEMHANERVMRGSFLNQLNLDGSELIIAVDADEIIYRKSYLWIKTIFALLPKKHRNFSLKLYQFQYKMNYLWLETICRATTVVSAEIAAINTKKLRDVGRLIPIWAGCHFSWQLSAEEMMIKISKYAHNPDYLALARIETLNRAIKEKTYPFEPFRPFTLKELDKSEFNKIAPKSFSQVKGYFPTHLIDGL